MNKLNGISFLKNYGLKTVNLIEYDEIIKQDYVIHNGLSLRLASRGKNNIDVNLPSIHNCYDKEIIKKFYKQYFINYEVLIHKTVKPVLIGSISKYYINDRFKIVIETYNNFEERKNGIIKDRAIFDFVNERYLDFYNCKNKDYLFLGNVVKEIPFENFDLEFVKEEDGFIFTDFYSDKLDKSIFQTGNSIKKIE